MTSEPEIDKLITALRELGVDMLNLDKITHDSLCPTRSTGKKKHCACVVLQKARAQGFSEGRYEGVMLWAWVCDDCGNMYGPDVTDCPNRTLDELWVERRNAFRADSE